MYPWVLNNLAFSYFVALVMTSVFYFLAPDKWKLSLVSFATFFFLLLVSPVSCLWLTVSSFWVGYSLHRKQVKTAFLIFIIALVFLLSQYFSKPGLTQTLPNTLAVLGVAYYTCRHIHMLVEFHKGKIHEVSLKNYIHYSFFFPVLINGPIHRYPHFIRSCQRRHFSCQDFFQGAERILYGYAKIVLLGNYFFNTLIQGWLNPHINHSFFWQFIGSANAWFALYAVFSGYTDVALGFAESWGIRIEENFNKPLLARNLIEFWQRWHITLSQWCKDYIYLPALAFSRNAFLSVILAMIGIGIWHAFSIFYLFWACYQALGIVLCRLYQRKDFLHLSRLPQKTRHGITRFATFFWLFSAKPVIFYCLHAY